jgi:hypothetical protein
MPGLWLSDDLIQQLEMIAAREQRGVEDIVRSMVEQYEAKTMTLVDEDMTPNPNPLIGLIGLLDEYTNETDLSTTVQETLKKYSHPQYGWTKPNR